MDRCIVVIVDKKKNLWRSCITDTEFEIFARELLWTHYQFNLNILAFINHFLFIFNKSFINRLLQLYIKLEIDYIFQLQVFNSLLLKVKHVFHESIENNIYCFRSHKKMVINARIFHYKQNLKKVLLYAILACLLIKTVFRV